MISRRGNTSPFYPPSLLVLFILPLVFNQYLVDGQTVQSQCTFDTGTSCGFTQDTTDTFNWALGAGSAGGTGINADKSLGTATGIYAYVPAGQTTGTARYVSSTITTSGPVCIQFYYFKSTGGVINVYLRQNGFDYGVDYIDGAPGAPWQLRQKTVIMNNAYQVVIEALLDNSYNPNGVFAIDDLQLYTGLCTTPAADIPNQLRLVGGPNTQEGRVEVNYNNVWGGVCQDGFDTDAAKTACLQLGMSGGRTMYLPSYGVSTSQFWLDDLDCMSSSGTIIPALGQCIHAPWGTGDCRPNQSARVRCNVDEPPAVNTRLRLVGGVQSGNQMSGRVEVQNDGTWGTVCSQGWDNNDAQAICNMLGYRGTALATTNSQQFGQGTGRIWLNNIQCPAGAEDFFDCANSGYGNTGSCTHFNDAGVVCNYLSTEVGFSCNFDTGDNCQFIRDSTDPYQWIFGSPGVTTHSGSQAMYVQGNANPAGSATVVNRVIDVNPTSPYTCVRFWWLATAQSAPPLYVLAKRYDVAGNQQKRLWWATSYPVFSFVTNQWRQEQLFITIPKYALVFTADRGPTRSGNIIVDDITVSSGPCSGDVPPVDGGQLYWSCSFNNNDQCAANLNVQPAGVQGSSFPWTINTGATPSDGTGPTAGNNGGGYYMYIEASGKTNGQFAYLTSDASYPSDNVDRCLSFYYHANGQSLGALTVYLGNFNSGNQATWRQLFKFPETPGPSTVNQWIQRQIDLRGQGSGNIIFQGMVGSSFSGDIAVDDISVTQSACSAACVGENCPTNQVWACNFDQGLCPQLQSLPVGGDAEFQWTRAQGQTSTIGTGPTADHTQGNFNGFYMYIETSPPRVPQQNAVLLSTSPLQADNAARCFTFWYHIYGTSVGSLQVWLGTRTGTFNINRIQLLFQQPPVPSSVQNNQWLSAQVDIPGTNLNNYYIIIDGVVGDGSSGDIAIDDVALANGQCGSPPGQQGSFECSFDENNPCFNVFENVNPATSSAAQLQWIRQRGQTTTFNTGPNVDHTTGSTLGYYYYLETSTGNPGDRALLKTIYRYPGTQQYCLSFWYHMYGTSIGALRVSMANDNNLSSRRELWFRQPAGGQSFDQSWQRASVTIPTNTGGGFVFMEGIRGNGQSGDIAVDDITATPGACTDTPPVDQIYFNCNFETDECPSYMRKVANGEAGVDFQWTRNQGGTRSANTGPTGDHTLGTAAGWYMYTEASQPRIAGDSAIMITTNQYPSGVSKCMTIWYHMYGINIGTLVVSIGDLNNRVEKFRQSGEQGGTTNANQWFRTDLTFGPNEIGNIMIEGIIGGGYYGDIAIDDISIQQCGGNEGNQQYFSCDFETNQCPTALEIVNNNNADSEFMWQRQAGCTPTSGTGPCTDHTPTGVGYYMYIEADNRNPSDNAYMQTQYTYVNDGVARCLTFWYYISGTTIGALTVNIGQLGSSVEVWKQPQQWGSVNNPQWVQAQVNLQGRAGRVIFDGVRGSGIFGDIAVDDISVAAGTCEEAPPTGVTDFTCNFDLNACTQYLVPADPFSTPAEYTWTRLRGPTPTALTGPTQDHTTGSGYYMYAEADGNLFNGNNAYLRTVNTLSTGVQRCLSFWYYRYGQNVGLLTVKLLNTNYQEVGQVWSSDFQSLPQWRCAQVDFTTEQSSWLAIEAMRGATQFSDLAVDDVTLKSGGPCSVVEQNFCETVSNNVEWTCTFESDDCQSYLRNVPVGEGGADLTWQRTSGSTPSTDTGPDGDHTTGNGFYSYIEVSGRGQGMNAFYITTNTYPADGVNRCMTIWYHMYGSGIGFLTVSRGTLQQRTELFRQPVTVNPQTNRNWQRGQINMSGSQSGAMIIEGIVGNNIQGDIAIDDISVAQGTCTDTGVGTEYFTCNFDASACPELLYNVPPGEADGEFQWTRNSGLTQSGRQGIQTGPFGDHTSGGGQYMYTNAANRIPGENAYLRTQYRYTNVINTDRCLTFWYFLRGSNIGALSVLIGNPGSATELWKQPINFGPVNNNQWQRAQVNLRAQSGQFSDGYVIFNGVRGNGISGDIAIDDVNVASGPCTTVGEGAPTFTCDFNNDNCNQYMLDVPTINSPAEFTWLRQTGSTPSFGTGPSADRSGFGFYKYVESTGRNFNDNALYRTLYNYADGQQYCLQFYYFMYGNNVGQLSVWKMDTNNNLIGGSLWSYPNTMGVNLQIQSWTQVQVTIPSSPAGYIVFNGAVTGQEQGDIAIDDVSVTLGVCESTGTNRFFTCTFDQDQCADLTTISPATSDAEFTWTRRIGQTPTGQQTGQTGPQTDRGGPGWYMYIETSAPRVPNDNAYLRTTASYTNDGRPKCLILWYNAFGSGIGSLRIFTGDINGANRNLIQTMPNAFVASSDRTWRQWQVSIPTVNTLSQYYVIIDGVRGNNENGDIAIDDVTMVDGSCPDTTPTETIPYFSCNSDDCPQYMVDIPIGQTGADFTWTLRSGSTPTFGTGPNSDASGGSGSYYYIEATGRNQGDNAFIRTRHFYNENMQRCLTFSYYMYGSTIGQLRVWRLDQNFAPIGNFIWQQPSVAGSSQQNQQWVREQLNLAASQTGYLVFEASVFGDSGDIAIDDISVSQGTCQTVTEQFFTCNSDTCAPYLSNIPVGQANAEFNWQLRSGSTPTFNTGPDTDRSGGGSYYYIEASNRNQNDNALLRTTQFYNVNSQICLRFYYYMFGTSIGQLRIWRFDQNLQPIGNFLWQQPSVSGSTQQNRQWVLAQYTFQPNQQGYIVIEGVVFGDSGDIAIDDISVTSGSCTGTNPTTNGQEFFSCNFEQAPEGGQVCQDALMSVTTSSPGPEFEWTRNDGGTRTALTGPPGDHTDGLGTLGNYMYIEASAPRVAGENAYLRTVYRYNADGRNKCLHLWYHMLGDNIGSLNIYVRDSLPVEPLRTQQALRRVGPNGGNGGISTNTQWQELWVSIPGTQQGNIYIEGVIGSGIQADIAIDDVEVIANSCPF